MFYKKRLKVQFLQTGGRLIFERMSKKFKHGLKSLSKHSWKLLNSPSRLYALKVFGETKGKNNSLEHFFRCTNLIRIFNTE